jgi:hypothetical protein
MPSCCLNEASCSSSTMISPEARQRRENRQAGTENEVGLAGKGATPVALARRFGQFAVQRDHVRSGKTATHAVFQLRRQVDFRHQQQHLPPKQQGLLDQAQVNLGLAAAGDAEQQLRGIATVDRNLRDGASACSSVRPVPATAPAACAGARPGAPAATGASGRPAKPAGRLRRAAPDSKYWQTRTRRKNRRAKGRMIAQDFPGRLQLPIRPFALLDHGDDDTDPFAPPERHPHPQADIGGRRFRPGIRTGDAGADRGRRADGHDGPENSWGSAFHLSTKAVDNFVDCLMGKSAKWAFCKAFVLLPKY